jgi:hypothetical protein
MSNLVPPSDIEDSLRVILTVAANSYPGERMHAAFDSDGDISENFQEVGDSLAYSIAVELKDSYIDGAGPLLNLGAALQMLTNMTADLQETRDGLKNFTIDRVIYDFLVWLRNDKRPSVAFKLFNSWVDVYPVEAVRGLSGPLRERFLSYLPKFGGDGENMVHMVADIDLEGTIAKMTERLSAWFKSPKDEEPAKTEPPALLASVVVDGVETTSAPTSG